ncbi:MAG: hypothetical protein ABJD07_06440 [Gemmatimonadaceae bacterium]
MSADRRPPAAVPFWARALLGADKIVQRGASAMAAARDEMLLAWLSPEGRDALTSRIYARTTTYAPGGVAYEGGLVEWEMRAVTENPFPRAGRVLVGAAGSGREAVALQALGYDVVAFDSCAPLVARASSAAGDDRGVALVVASYADLVDAVDGRGGPLASTVAGAPFDAIVLGWVSLSHVTRERDRVALLAALKRLAPAAPVLVSFAALRRPAPHQPWRLRVRRLLATLGAPNSVGPTDAFWSHAGFFAILTPEMIRTEVQAAGYDVAYLRETPSPHAMLVPAAR